MGLEGGKEAGDKRAARAFDPLGASEGPRKRWEASTSGILGIPESQATSQGFRLSMKEFGKEVLDTLDSWAKVPPEGEFVSPGHFMDWSHLQDKQQTKEFLAKFGLPNFKLEVDDDLGVVHLLMRPDKPDSLRPPGMHPEIDDLLFISRDANGSCVDWATAVGPLEFRKNEVQRGMQCLAAFLNTTPSALEVRIQEAAVRAEIKGGITCLGMAIGWSAVGPVGLVFVVGLGGIGAGMLLMAGSIKVVEKVSLEADPLWTARHVALHRPPAGGRIEVYRLSSGIDTIGETRKLLFERYEQGRVDAGRQASVNYWLQRMERTTGVSEAPRSGLGDRWEAAKSTGASVDVDALYAARVLKIIGKDRFIAHSNWHK